MDLTVKVKYAGNLRCNSTHLKSENKLTSDAPTDNNGRGEAFSPTDLLATALATCMLTVMGIKARSMDFDLEEATADVIKIMESEPRRVGEIIIRITLKQNCDDKTKILLEKTAINCPVAKSLSSDLKQSISFNWI